MLLEKHSIYAYLHHHSAHQEDKVQLSADQMCQIFSLMLTRVHYLLNNDGLTKPVAHNSNYLLLSYTKQFKQN